MIEFLNLENLKKYQIATFGYTESLVPVSFNHFSNWISDGLAGELSYLTDHRKDKRKSLKEYYPECESVLVFLFDYIKAKKNMMESSKNIKIASYALGFDDQDYHFWIKEKLELIGEELKKDVTSLDYKVSLDIHPVLERDFAYQAGLGWFGKNSMLINREVGSFTLIGSLILNKKLNLKSKKTESDHCGNCRKCIDACPTGAINEKSRTLDAALCVSTYTIETFKEKTPPKGFPNSNNDIFGCDICQDVCPWNSKPLDKVIASSSHLLDSLDKPPHELYQMIDKLSNKQYKTKFKRTSFERLGKKGFLKNLNKYL